MKPQEDKNVQPETNDKQAKPVKRILTATMLRHQSGMVVQTNLKAALCDPKACHVTSGRVGCDCG